MISGHHLRSKLNKLSEVPSSSLLFGKARRENVVLIAHLNGTRNAVIKIHKRESFAIKEQRGSLRVFILTVRMMFNIHSFVHSFMSLLYFTFSLFVRPSYFDESLNFLPALLIISLFARRVVADVFLAANDRILDLEATMNGEENYSDL